MLACFLGDEIITYFLGIIQQMSLDCLVCMDFIVAMRMSWLGNYNEVKCRPTKWGWAREQCLNDSEVWVLEVRNWKQLEDTSNKADSV